MTTSLSHSESGSFVPSRTVVWICRILCMVALSISGYLAWTAFNTAEVYGCGSGEVFDCSHVLNSKYSKIFGLPVSVPAFGLYASLLGVLFFMTPRSPEKLLKMGWAVLTVGAVAAALAAVWFTGVQVLELKHLCPYCLGAHSCGLILAAIIIWENPFQLKTAGGLSSLSMLFVGMLIAGQVTAEDPQTFVVERFDDTAEETLVSAAEPMEFGAPAEFAPPAGADDANLFAAPEVIAPPVVDNEFAPPAGAVVEEQPVPESVAIDVPPLETPATSSTASNSDGDDLTKSDEADNSNSPEAAEESPTVAAASILMFISPSTASLAAKVLAVDGTSESGSESKSASDATANTESPNKNKEERLVTVAGNKFSLNTRHWPLLGSPDAKYIFVEMFDYTCPHCQKTHGAIDGAFDRFGDDLAVIALPVPLDGSCNDTVTNTSSSHRNACELARISVAVWRVSPSKFKEFHDWMFERTRSTAAARSQAEKLVGKEKLKAELDLPHAKNYISRHVELYKRVGRGSVPKLMFPKSTMTGAVTSSTTLCSTIERELGN